MKSLLLLSGKLGVSRDNSRFYLISCFYYDFEKKISTEVSHKWQKKKQTATKIHFLLSHEVDGENIHSFYT